MSKSLQFYKNVSTGLTVTVVMVIGMLVWQMSQKSAVTTVDTQNKLQLASSYLTYVHSYQGMKEAAAIAKAKDDGLSYIIVERDGKQTIHAGEVIPTPIQLHIEDGIVVQAEF